MKSILTKVQVLGLLIALPALAQDVGLHKGSAQPTRARMMNILRGVMMTDISKNTGATQSGQTQHAWLHQLFKTLLIFLLGTSIASCAEKTITYQEEVKLLDGRVITIAKKYGYPNGVVFREAWITLKLPETGNQETTWHEHLQPTNLNVVNGKLYIVGMPMTDVEFISYQFPRPPYVGYVFDDKVWKRITFKEIPEAMYTMNLSYGNNYHDSSGPLSLADKEKYSKNADLSNPRARIDPSYKDSSDEAYSEYKKHH